MKRIFSIFLITYSLLGYAQNEANIWYFGKYAGLDFNYNPPQALINGALKTDEGCSSISDSLGNILFYTDGSTVYNKNHEVMEGGLFLKGNASSTQSAIIARKPASLTEFYIFTTDAAINGQAQFGFNYSIVDLSYNNGLGKVTIKNSPLISGTCTEKVNGVLHSNKRDIWIVTHKNLTNEFYSYLLTPSGLNTTPVITKIGTNHTRISNNIPDKDVGIRGVIKFSVDGEKIASTIEYMNVIELFDFNSSTGELSNVQTIQNLTYNPYGLEFSPNGSRLYASSRLGSNTLWQYDADTSDFVNSGIRINEVPYVADNNRCALQLAPDGKIYIAIGGKDHVGVISEPNKRGVACNLDLDAVYLYDRMCLEGLPTVIQSYVFAPNFLYTQKCLGDSTWFNIINIEDSLISSVEWDFGVSNSTTDSSTKKEPYFIYSDTGIYQVKLVITSKSNLKYYAQKYVEVLNGPKLANISQELKKCSADIIKVTAGPLNLSYKWSHLNNDVSFVNLVDTGHYWVEATDECGTTRRNFHIVNKYPPQFNVSDTSMCKGDSITVTLHADKAYTYKAPGYWGTDTNYTIYSGGDYFWEAQNECGITRKYYKVYEDTFPHVEVIVDGDLCENDSVLITAIGNYNEIKWNGVTGNSSQYVYSDGNYEAVVTNACGQATDDVVLSYRGLPVMGNIADTTICANDSVLLMLNNTFTNYDSLMWLPNNKITPEVKVPYGTYNLKLINSCGEVLDTINIDTVIFNAFDIEINDPVCYHDSVLVKFTTPGYDSVIWMPDNIKGNQFYAKPGDYSITAINKCYSVTDDFTVKEDALPPYILPNDTIVCDAEELKMRLSDSTNLLWIGVNVIDGVAVIDKAGNYSITLSHCDTTISKYFSVDIRNTSLYVPNAFTPDGTGLNDVFKPVGQFENDKRYSLKIFNRWGELLYITTNTEAGWDGTYAGKPAPIGAYMYMISYTDCEGNFQYISGSVTLLR